MKKCPYCGNEFSIDDFSCPTCGYNEKKYANVPDEVKKKRQSKIILFISIVGFLITAFIAFIISIYSASNIYNDARDHMNQIQNEALNNMNNIQNNIITASDEIDSINDK